MHLVYPPNGEPIRVADKRLAEHLASRPGWRMELEAEQNAEQRPPKRRRTKQEA